MRDSIRKTAVAAIAALGMAAAAATISTPAQAQWHGGGGFHGGGFHGGGWGGGGWRGGGWHGGWGGGGWGWRRAGWGGGWGGGDRAHRGRDRFAAGLWWRAGLLGQATRLDGARPLSGQAACQHLLLSARSLLGAESLEVKKN